MKTWIVPASMTLICWGLWAFIPKITTRHISPMSAVVYESVGALTMGVIVLAMIHFRPDVNARGIFLAVVTGMLGMAGGLGFLFAVRSGKVSVVAMFTSLSPLITIALGYVVLNEAITLKEGFGILSAFIAIVLFSA
ncbi:EamA family transporter [Desulfobacter vibrioformis]|uniref:EamA family transporter n=1 Tax=Desulfobacter vibrioformis TaxID=34031 RepID=UPI000554DF7F|nr:EamA family transporter [Desulfobacter vibrioformis]